MSGNFLLGATDGGVNGSSIKSNASVAAGGSGGEASHTLTILEMPKHRHNIEHIHKYRIPAQWRVANGSTASKYDGMSDNKEISIDQSTKYSDYAGSDGSHNNMPPFLAVYMWKITS